MSSSNPSQISRHAKGLPPLWDKIQSYGVTLEQCIEGTGVTKEQALGSEAGFTLEVEFALYRNIMRLCKDPLLGLSLGAAYTPTTFGILGYALLSANNLRELCELSCEFAALTYSHFRFQVLDSTAYFGTRLDIVHALPEDLLQLYCDRDVQSGLTLLEAVGAPASPLSEVRLMHADEARKADYERRFGCPVLFGQTHNAILVEPALKQFVLPWSNEEAASRIRTSCLDLLAEIQSHTTLKSEIIEIMLDNPGSFPSLKDVADGLGFSARSLRRKLKEEGTSYQEILATVRLELAKQYLNSGVSVERIAELLDYSELSTFSRAFKSWTGKSPQHYRSDRS